MCVVNHKYQYIFFHEPHCGGRAIEAALMEHEGSNNFGGHHHILLPDMLNKGFITWKQLTRYFKFRVIRNPFDWLVTAWIRNNHCKTPFEAWASSDQGQAMKNGTNTLFWRYEGAVGNWGFEFTLDGSLERCINIMMTNTIFAPEIKLPKIGVTEDKPDWKDLLTVNQAMNLAYLYPDIRNHGYQVQLGV